MPLRLRGSTAPEKQKKKKSFFSLSKLKKRNKYPIVEANNRSGSSNVVTAVKTESQSPAINLNAWYQPRGYFSEDSLQLINILSAVLMAGRNIYGITFVWDVFSPGTDVKQTYFTPAPWSFRLWLVIHALMLGSCFYQFSRRGSSVLLDQAGWKLPLLHVCNAIYIRCRKSQSYKYAFVSIVVTYMVVNKIYQKISKIPLEDIQDWLFCRLLFSLYHGWVLGLMFLAAFEAFGVDATTTPAHGWTKMSVLFSLMFIQLFQRAYSFPSTESDFFACFAISWFLFGITMEQSATRSGFVHWSALASSMLSLYWIEKCMGGLERTIGKFLRDSKPPVANNQR